MIKLEAIAVRFGGVIALDAVTAQFDAPVSGIIGPNGAGKTTIMNVISGFLTSTGGRVVCEGQNLLSLAPHVRTRWGLRRSFQREQIAEDLTVWENLMALADNLPMSKSERMADVERAADYAGVSDLKDRIGASLNTLERRLTDVARCMIGNPKLIMFDEPAGGMTPEESSRLGDLIMGIPSQTAARVLIIDHDVDLIQKICAETLVLDFGRRIAFGSTKSVLVDPAVQAAYLGTAEVDVDHA
jgi:branched-chain amino acid transport system ATP-binding protein